MPDERKEFEELTIKFGKGLAEDFTGKDGRYRRRDRLGEPEGIHPECRAEGNGRGLQDKGAEDTGNRIQRIGKRKAGFSHKGNGSKALP